MSAQPSLADRFLRSPKLVRDTPGGRTRIDIAITTLMVWAIEHGEPWSTPDIDSEAA